MTQPNLQKLLTKINIHMENMGFPLYNYQKEGVKWMIQRELLSIKELKGKGLLCDEPGLGKTIQTCALMYGNNQKRTLLILPCSVITQWISAINKILPNKNIYIHRGNNRIKKLDKLKKHKFDIAITTLGLLNNSNTILHSIQWNRIIIDEVHEIRNSKSKRAKSCYKLISENYWGLTGTPIQNGLKDLFSLYKFLKIPQNYNTKKNITIVNKYLILRRTKKVFEKKHKIPILNQKIHLLEFNSEDERAEYIKISTNISNTYQNLINNNLITGGEKMVLMFELLLRLRQVSIHPQLEIDGYEKKFKTTLPKFEKQSTKIKKLVDMLVEKTPTNNCLVFCNFKKEMNIIGNELTKNQIGFRIYDGSTSFSNRNKYINSFNNEFNSISDILTKWKKTFNWNYLGKKIEQFYTIPKVLLIQIKAGSVGLNLQQFTEVFILSPDWNPCNEIQAIARAHRIGQDNAVNVHRFRLHDNFNNQDRINTIDERIYEIQKKKRNLMAELLNDDTLKNIGKLSMKDIKTMTKINKLTNYDLNTLFI